eukprot:3140329-Rhodomonas_salina.2
MRAAGIGLGRRGCYRSRRLRDPPTCRSRCHTHTCRPAARGGMTRPLHITHCSSAHGARTRPCDLHHAVDARLASRSARHQLSA